MPQCNYANIRRDLSQLKAGECASKNRKSNSENSIALFKIAHESARKKMNAPAACNRKSVWTQLRGGHCVMWPQKTQRSAKKIKHQQAEPLSC
jgi:hypothetical protein